MSNKAPAAKVIFNTSAMVPHLAGLKAAAAEDAPWWRPALSFDWVSNRKAANCIWGNIIYTDAAGVSGPLRVRINGEIHVGRIMPTTDAGVAEMAARIKNPAFKIEKRDRKPVLQFMKWRSKVETADDEITPLCDASGKPILPPDSDMSTYYQVASFVDEAFSTEAAERINRGVTLMAQIAAEKKANKAVTAQAVMDAFIAVNGIRFAGDMILTSDNIAAIRKYFPTPKDVDILIKGATNAPNTKIAHIIQEHISDNSAKNAGRPMPNPIARISLAFNKDTGAAEMTFFDKTKPFLVDGKQKFEAATVEGEPINNDNVHYFIRSRSSMDGIIDMSSFCFSSMGMSMPVKATVLVVAAPTGFAKATYDDVYGDDDSSDAISADAVVSMMTSTVAALAAAPTAAPAAAPVAAAVTPKAPAAVAVAVAVAAPKAPAAVAPKAVAAAPKAVAAAAKKAPAVAAPPPEDNYGDLLEDLNDN